MKKTFLNRVVRKDRTEEMTFEQRSEEGASHLGVCAESALGEVKGKCKDCEDRSLTGKYKEQQVGLLRSGQGREQ